MRLSFLILSMLTRLSFLIISMLMRLSFLIISMLTRLSFLIISMLMLLARAYNKTTKQQNNQTTNLHTPREISGVAGYDVLICFDELACHAVIDTDGRTASGRTIGQHDGAIVLITQS